MKLTIADEARLIANKVNNKQYKNLLDPMTEEVMYLINEAAKLGQFQIKYESSPSEETITQTFLNNLSQMGYNVLFSEGVFTISWGVSR